MAKNLRDDFSPKTKELLAKRVTYLCSKPDCRTFTIASHTDPEKTTSIGIAAHITAASRGGPRYDSSLTPQERSSPVNGIWLCATHAAEIDKDPERFSVDLLKQWKEKAEEYTRDRLGKSISNISVSQPSLEADLFYNSRWRINRGFSFKNKEMYKEPIPPENPLYIHWDIGWEYIIRVYNNSENAVFNICINNISGLSNLKLTHDYNSRVNNLGALDFFDIRVVFENHYPDLTHIEADKILIQKLPDILQDKEIEIKYYDKNRVQYILEVKLNDPISLVNI